MVQNQQTVERDYVKQNMNSRLIENDLWQLISSEWFSKWKQYVDFDSNPKFSSDEVKIVTLNDFEMYFIMICKKNQISEKPGIIDNSFLQGDHENELKLGLQEGKDYILLPNTVADYLFGIYKVKSQVF